MNYKTVFPLFALASFISMPSVSHAVNSATNPDAVFDDRPYVSIWGSYDIADHLRHSGNGVGGGISVGKPFSQGLEIEVLGSYLRYGGRDATAGSGGLLTGILGGSRAGQSATSVQSVAVAGLGANLYLSQNGVTLLDGLYIHADAMYGKGAVYNVGFGYAIPLASKGPAADLSLRFEGLYRKQGSFDEPVFNIGLRLPIGKRADPLPPPAPPMEEIMPIPAPPPPPPPPPAPCAPPGPGQAMSMDGCKRGDVLVLRGVNFDYDKATLTVNAKALLDQVADALRKRSDIQVEIDGHTDGMGSIAYNQRLSDRRAQSVKAYLIVKAISGSRMTTRGFGKTMPIATNSTAEGRETNRRVELKVVGADEGRNLTPLNVMPPMQHASMTQTMRMDVPASLPAAEPVAASGPAAVIISNFAFAPADIVVAVGSTIKWTNTDSSVHTVTFADQDSDIIRKSATFSRTFTKPGVYEYHCSIHPGMTGKVTVQ